MTEPSPMLLTVLDGLIPLHLMRVATMSDHEQQRLALVYADQIAAAGDRLTAPGNFADRGDRAVALNALAAGLAIGAAQDGGIAWMGHHWCTQPHVNCANARKAAA